MVIANATDGKTYTLDLTNDEHRRSLSALIHGGTVTGLSIHCDGSINSLPSPKRFHHGHTFGYELIGGSDPIAERIYCQADGVRVILTRSFSSRHVRCDLVRTGRMRYNPVSNRSQR